MRLPILALVLLSLVWGAACTSSKPEEAKRAEANNQLPTQTATEFLKWSMQQHQRLRGYEATGTVGLWVNDVAITGAKRTVEYRAPNRFKIESTQLSDGISSTAICDGDRLIETSSTGRIIRSYPVPSEICLVSTILLSDPLLSGSLLYQFFGGAVNFDHLVNPRISNVEYGPLEPLGEGKIGVVVRFQAPDPYGPCEALIDKESGLVHRLRYSGNFPDPSGKAAKKVRIDEVYTKVRKDPVLTDALFAIRIPEGAQVIEMPSSERQAAPVAFGTPAPNFVVYDGTNAEVELASLKGKVVLLEFWATWCEPCRQSLPIVQALHDQYKARDLAVMAISREEPEVVGPFVKSQKVTVPVYLDRTLDAWDAYRIASLPTFVVIDREGRLIDYLIGPQPESKLLDSLRQAPRLASQGGSRPGVGAPMNRGPQAAGGGGRLDRFVASLMLGLLILAAGLIVSGLLLHGRYVPTVAGAHSSVAALHEGGLIGWIARFHEWGTALFLLVGGGLIGLIVFTSGYKSPNEWRWWSLVALVAAVFGLQVTGHLLPFDRHGVQTAAIEAGVGGRIPFLGSTIREAMLQGAEVSGSTLEAWYLVHRWLLPLVVVAAVISGIVALARRRETKPMVWIGNQTDGMDRHRAPGRRLDRGGLSPARVRVRCVAGRFRCLQRPPELVHMAPPWGSQAYGADRAGLELDRGRASARSADRVSCGPALDRP